MACWHKKHNEVNHCLVIVPAAVKWNWPLEIEKFTNESYVVIDGKPDDRIAQWQGKLVCKRRSNGKYEYKKGKPFFYVVNYELITEDLFGGRTIRINADDTTEQQERKKRMAESYAIREAKLKQIRDRVFDMIVVDEAHYMKNHSSKRTRNIKSLKSRYRVALTGTPLDGRLEELHSVMEFVKPGLFPSKSKFMIRHAEVDFFGKVKKYKKVDEVREIIKPFFLRRLKKDVMKELPDKLYKNVYVEMSSGDIKKYKDIADHKHPATEDSLAITRIIRCKQFCDHPALVGEYKSKSAKLASLMEMLEELVKMNSEKVLIFTQYKEMLDLIDGEMKGNGYHFLRIDGDTKPKIRADIQGQFNDDSRIDAVIGTEAMSTGLNLTGATYVINYDDNWAPAIMRQREDRTHRSGQKNCVTVINFIVKDTIEERIRDVLYSKELVSTEALGDDTDEMVLRRMNPVEIARLL